MKDENLSLHRTENYKTNKGSLFWREAKKQKYLLLMSLPALIIVFVFLYMPMYGVLIAFKDYQISKGIFFSEWVGLKWFKLFFETPVAWQIIKNTLILAFYSIVFTFPAPIMLAILLNEIPWNRYKKLVQTISYLPYFISTVIMVGMLKNLASMDGLFNQITAIFGNSPINYFADIKYFRTLFISSGIWQTVGWSSIIYLAALAGIDTEQYEAAQIDGANRFQKIWFVTLPNLLPTITILFILNAGSALNQDYQKILLMYNPSTYEVADIIGSYVYREGIEGARFSYTSAVGLFTSVLSCGLMFLSNLLSKISTGSSLW